MKNRWMPTKIGWTHAGTNEFLYQGKILLCFSKQLFTEAHDSTRKRERLEISGALFFQ